MAYAIQDDIAGLPPIAATNPVQGMPPVGMLLPEPQRRARRTATAHQARRAAPGVELRK